MHKRISLLASMDPSNIIHLTDTEEGESRMGTPPTSSAPPSSYALRNRRAPEGKLVYDAKYHPMDDSIKPSQAAKRRSAHEEIELSSDDETETFSVPSRSEEDEESDKEDLMKKFRPSKSKKRSRSLSESLQPTRRSSRRTTKIKVSYNMNVHPQDRYLEITSSDDDHSEASSHTSKRKKASHVSRKDPIHESMHQARALSTTTIADSEAEEKDEIGNEQLTCGNLDDSQPDVDTIHVKVRGKSKTYDIRQCAARTVCFNASIEQVLTMNTRSTSCIIIARIGSYCPSFIWSSPHRQYGSVFDEAW